MKLKLLSFGSIFELFATFTLAYILVDELTRRNFVSLVTEKARRSYQANVHAAHLCSPFWESQMEPHQPFQLLPRLR